MLRLVNEDAAAVGTFDDFWAIYPNKKAKKEAMKAWSRIRMTPELWEKIVQSIALYKRCENWLDGGGKFIPHPATWLNGERWDDEIEVAVEGEQCAWNRNGSRGPEGRCTKGSVGSKNGQPYCRTHLGAA